MATLQLKLRCCCIIAFLLLTVAAYSQTTITGRVVNEKDDTPLPGASVYFNNTTIATTTNAQGNFQFETVRMLNTELVIYCSGYELMLYKPTARQVEGKRIVFKMMAKVTDSVKKLNLSDDDRQRLLTMFHYRVFGVTEESMGCSILNKNSIYFTRGDSPTTIRALADEPLAMMNNMLGYKIIFNLEEFEYDQANDKDYTIGYARFEDLGISKKWIRNRKNCYNGSSMHFYRSLVKHQLFEQGFGTFSKKIVNRKLPTKILIGDTSIMNVDSTVVAPLSAGDILYIDSSNELSIRAGRLIVQYYKNTAAQAFLTRHGTSFAGELNHGVETTIVFKEPQVGINYAGVLNDAESVIYSGYWLYEKLGNRLPFNYVSD